MYKLLYREIDEYIVQYDSDYSEGSYQFAGLIINDTDGDEISINSIDTDEIDDFKELQKKINNAVGSYFGREDVEKFIKSEFDIPVDRIEITIEPM